MNLLANMLQFLMEKEPKAKFRYCETKQNNTDIETWSWKDKNRNMKTTTSTLQTTAKPPSVTTRSSVTTRTEQGGSQELSPMHPLRHVETQTTHS